MDRLGIILLALAGGFVAGIVLSQIIGIVGYVGFDRAIGIRGLPIIMALGFAGAAVYQMRQRR